MLPIFTALHLPRTLFGAGSLALLPDELNALGVRRPMLVTDKGLVKAGLVEKLVSACRDTIALTVFDTVTENPLFSDVDRGAREYARAGCDGIIALGGGSVIDAAKFIALLATNAGVAADFAGAPGAKHGPGAPLIVIPTTAGTGSEASPSAGIHPDAHTATLGMSSRHLVPKVAILDPDLTASLPKRLTAATGIDALSHCVEGYLSKRDLPLGKSIALDGIARVTRSLRSATVNRDPVARADMMLAAYAGGASIGMGLGPAHAFAITCSDQGFHHGILSGIGMVATLDATAAHVPDRVAELAAAFGVKAPLSEAIAALMTDLGLPITLAGLGYTVTDVSTLGKAAQRSHFNASAPFHPSAEEYAAMIAASASR
ncbi:MAG: alcohol dehydrogenase [Rhizobium sp.]|nr:alcohol dehydrogenase [Rhizobium sp.]